MIRCSNTQCRNFYPRPPGGGRRIVTALPFHVAKFLSTPSGWRATLILQISITSGKTFLSTPSGWRATAETVATSQADTISIHALRVEGDTGDDFLLRLCRGFLSTPSGWRATAIICAVGGVIGGISIHALRVEGDPPIFSPSFFISDFYPRPPGGGRQQKRTKFSSVFAQKGEEFASLRRGKRKICRWRFKKDKFWVLIWCEGSGKSVCALASHCG